MSKHNENAIQITNHAAPVIDWTKCRLRAPKGRVIVEMDPMPETINGLAIPQNTVRFLPLSRQELDIIIQDPRVPGEEKRACFDQYNEAKVKSMAQAADFTPDTGTVLAVGKSLDPRKPIGLLPGDRVCVRGYDGIWIDGVSEGYEATGQVRVYGVAVPYEGEPMYVEWWDSIPVRLSMQGKRATGRNIIIRRDPLIEQEGIVWLPDEAQYRNGYATVESVGEQVTDCKAGDRVHYTGKALIEFAFDGDDDLAVCTEEAINFVVEEAVA